jgi:hypothetical protein
MVVEKETEMVKKKKKKSAILCFPFMAIYVDGKISLEVFGGSAGT